MIKQRVPKILFIKEVFKKNCISDEIFEKKYTENINQSSNNDIQLKLYEQINEQDKLPTVFKSLQEWPKTTNLFCWNCTLPFNQMPVFIPKVIEPVVNKIQNIALVNQNIANFGKQKNYSITVHGVFCSFGCAFMHIKDKTHSVSEATEYRNRLNFLHKIFYGKYMKDFHDYPRFQDMVFYGGDLTREQFRNKIEEINKHD